MCEGVYVRWILLQAFISEHDLTNVVMSKIMIPKKHCGSCGSLRIRELVMITILENTVAVNCTQPV